MGSVLGFVWVGWISLSSEGLDTLPLGHMFELEANWNFHHCTQFNLLTQLTDNRSIKGILMK